MAAAEDEKKYRVTLEVTSLQEESIKAFFAHNDWDYIKIETQERPHSKKRCKTKKIPVAPGPSNQPEQPEPHESGQAFEMAQDTDNDDCPYCFLSPCVTQRDNWFLGDGQGACEENSRLRKLRYQKYWNVISNLGGWEDPRYIRKKIAAGDGEWVVKHQREVMPECVLKQVRNLYPNPPNQPYMGHRWW